MCHFVRNWRINEDLVTESDHELIQFELTSNKAELVESPFVMVTATIVAHGLTLAIIVASGHALTRDCLA